MNTQKYDVIIIGGGAGGLFLAAMLPPSLKIAILEGNDRVGKKLLATGNGKCNLTNLDMNIVHYNKPSFVEEFLDKFDAHDTIASFEKMGLITKVVDKRVYPYSARQACLTFCAVPSKETASKHFALTPSISSKISTTDST